MHDREDMCILVLGEYVFEVSNHERAAHWSTAWRVAEVIEAVWVQTDEDSLIWLENCQVLPSIEADEVQQAIALLFLKVLGAKRLQESRVCVRHG